MMVHTVILSNLCRLCGSQYTGDSKPSSKGEFQRDILAIWNIDVNLDERDVHPPSICASCRLKISRWKKQQRQKGKNSLLPNIELTQFLQHGPNCGICEGYQWEGDSLIEACKQGGMFSWRKDNKIIGITVDDEGCHILKRIIFDTYKKEIHTYICGTEVESLQVPHDALKYLVGGKLCNGNIDFTDLAALHQDTGFKGRHGEIVARVEESHVHAGSTAYLTVRHVNCKLLLFGDDEPTSSIKQGDVCSVCTLYRSTLAALASKQKATDVPRQRSKSTKYLGMDELKQRVEDLKKENKNINQRNKRLFQKIQSLMQNEGVDLDQTTSEQVEQLVDSCEVELSSLFEPDSYCHLLWEEQKKARRTKAKQMRWHPAIIRWAIAIHTKSASAYDLLRKSGFLSLPHVNTLYQYTHFTNPVTGINEELLLRFYSDWKMESMEPHERLVTLLIDEMKVKSGLAFSRSSGKLVGFSSVGSVADEMIRFEKRCTDDKEDTYSPPLASHVLLYMVRGVTSSMKFPAAYFATTNVTGSELYQTTLEVIKAVKLLGLKVICLTSDGAAANRKLYEILGGRVQSALSPPFCSVSPYETGRLYFYCDPPHLLKTIRNNFENSNWNRRTRNLVFRGNKIQWTQLVALYEWDKGTDRATPGLQLLPKLSYEHLHLTPGLRMKVSLAAQVMSSTIANALEVWKQPGLESTILFIRKVNKFFDCLNVSSVLEGKRKRNPDLMPFTSCDDPRLQWLEEDFLAFLKEWAEEGDKLEGLSPKEKQRLCMSQATVTGCHITVKTFVEMTKQLLQSEGVKFVLSDKFNQDPLEEFFGKQRSAGGHRDNPTVEQFGHSLVRNVVAGSSARGSVRGNVRLHTDAPASITEEPLPKRKRGSVRFSLSKEAPN